MSFNTHINCLATYSAAQHLNATRYQLDNGQSIVLT